MIALTRDISSGIVDCELTHLDRTPIDLARAHRQHQAYTNCLEALGCRIQRVPGDPELPDCVFIEDTAVVVPELAVMTRPGALSRRGELPMVESALAEHRTIARIEAPGTLDGGDVLRIGRRIWVGAGPRSNAEGIRQLARHLGPHGYEVVSADYRGCLHFKSACTLAGEGVVLLNPEWVSPELFPGLDVLTVAAEEPFAANVLAVEGRVIVDLSFPRTIERLLKHGLEIRTVDNSELARAEGGLTCGCILLD